jgi:hypothetical protein
MTWLPPVLFFASLFFQFCNVAEVMIIRQMIKANLARDQKKMKVKDLSILFATLLELNTKVWQFF